VLEAWQARAQALIDQLLADGPSGRHELARRFGLRNIIFNRLQFNAENGYEPTEYKGANPHTHHVHFAWSWKGAKGQTSGYESKGGAPVVAWAFHRNGGDHELGDVGGVEPEAEEMIGTIANVRGLSETSQPFRRELLAMCARLNIDPDAMAAVISFETGGTFSPAVKNPASGATGLIQFTRKTAERLGTSQAELSRMSGVQQLAYVEKYLLPVAGKLSTVADHYMAIFAPVGIGKPPDFPLYSAPSVEYERNQALDRDKDGMITKVEASEHVIALLEDAETRPRIEVRAPAGGSVVVATVGLMAVGALVFLSRGRWW